jgi:hypothetical protein
MRPTALIIGISALCVGLPALGQAKLRYDRPVNIITSNYDLIDTTYIDRGRLDGVKVGDKFEVKFRDGKVATQVVVTGVFERMASVKIVDEWLLKDGQLAKYDQRPMVVALERGARRPAPDIKVQAKAPAAKAPAAAAAAPAAAAPAAPSAPSAPAGMDLPPAAPGGEPGDALGLPPMDGGLPPMDGPMDSGLPPMDGGLPPGPDAGLPPMDAGLPPGPDAGLPPMDAGLPPGPDAGLPPMDAGLPPMDSGLPPDMGGMDIPPPPM